MQPVNKQRVRRRKMHRVFYNTVSPFLKRRCGIRCEMRVGEKQVVHMTSRAALIYTTCRLMVGVALQDKPGKNLFHCYQGTTLVKVSEAWISRLRKKKLCLCGIKSGWGRRPRCAMCSNETGQDVV
jgi:hypothetical protein